MLPSDPFKPVVKPENFHPGFKALLESPGFEPARAMIREIFVTFEDVDGNFIEQFQTTAYDARTWELFLHVFFQSIGAKVDRTHPQPDFAVTFRGVEFNVEAVTANPSQLSTGQGQVDIPGEDEVGKVRYKQEQLRPIRLGSALYSKLQRRYWELPHVAGRPLVLALEDFHEPGSLFWGSSSLWQYLYGIRGTWYLDSSGKLHIDELPVTEHKHGSKVIPSGFFDLPGAEHISAVLFGNTGTVTKFNRMGYQKGYGRSERLKMVRVGTCYNHDPNSPVPFGFSYEVGAPGSPPEHWGQGLELYHNPHAAHPLPMRLLPVAYHFHDGGTLRSFVPDFHPLGSITQILMLRDE